MYEQIVCELAENGGTKRYINERVKCRYCGVSDSAAFGSRDNAHAFPAALGNRVLFAMDECKACNSKFSVYEDALTKAVGPFLTLGGVRGRKGVRQTGRSTSNSKIQHSSDEDGRRLSFVSQGNPRDLVNIDPATGIMKLRIPIVGDKFVPRYAYKALQKIAISILPTAELPRFKNAIERLSAKDAAPQNGPLQVGFSYAFVGNAVPALAGCLLRRTGHDPRLPYMIFLFMAGSVCFQIWLKSDEADSQVPDIAQLGIRYSAQLPKPEGGYFPVQFCEPIQLDWSDIGPVLQPFEAFELHFNPRNTQGSFTPIQRR